MIFNPWESKDDVYIAGNFYFVLNVPGMSTVYSLHAYLEHQISQVLRILTTFNFSALISNFPHRTIVCVVDSVWHTLTSVSTIASPTI